MKIPLQKACRYLFLITIFLMPLYLIKVKIFFIPTNIFELLAISSVCLYLLSLKFSNVSQSIIPLRNLLLGIALLLSGLIISIVFNENIQRELGILKSWFVIPLIFSFFLYLQIKKQKDIEEIFAALFYSTSAVAFISLAYKALGLLTFDGRLKAFYLSPNHLAMYLASGFIAGLYFAIKDHKQIISFRSLLSISLLLLNLLAIYFTYSYGAWIALTFSLIAVTFIQSNKRQALIIISVLILTLLGVFLFQSNNEKFKDLSALAERSSLSSRLTIWKVSIDLIKENPLVGVGPGNFQESYLSKQSAYPLFLEWAVPQPHNIFMAFWLQTGLLGLIGFLLIIYIAVKKTHDLIKIKKEVALATSLLIFIFYFLLHGMIDTTYWKNDLSVIFWLFAFIAFFSDNK